LNLREKSNSAITRVRRAGGARFNRERGRVESNAWWPYLREFARRVNSHELIDRGAALTYYGVLAVVPALLVVFSLIGLFGDSGTVNDVLKIIHEVGPENGDTAAREPLDSLIRQEATSGTLLGIALLGVLWTASAYVGCFFRASATIWDVERRPTWRAWPLRVALTIAMLFLVALALTIVVVTGQLAQSIGNVVGLGDSFVNLYNILKWPALLIVVVLLVSLLYWSSPSGERPVSYLRILTPGGAAAVFCWLLVSAGFEIYANTFATYDSTYGALGTTIASLIWLWLTNLTLLFGIELDSELQILKEQGATGKLF
jgi:membrane protein